MQLSETHTLFFDIPDQLREFFRQSQPHLILTQLPSFFNSILAKATTTRKVEGVHILNDRVYIGKNVTIYPTAVIEGPCYIADNATIGPSAYVRPFSYIGEGATVGHASEVKSSIVMPFSKASHYVYVGDSIIGSHVNLGAGVKLANVRFDNSEVFLRDGDSLFSTKFRKMGSIIGDHSSLGCNVVLNPGTIIQPRTWIANNPKSIVKGSL